MAAPNHQMYDKLLEDMEEDSGVSRNVLARVLVRMMITAPSQVTSADIASGKMLAKPSKLNQSAVSKAIARLDDEKLITRFEQRPDIVTGRPIKPLELGSSTWSLMGVKVVHEYDRPVRLYGVLTGMRVDRDLSCLAELEMQLPEETTFGTVADHIKHVHDKLLNRLPTGGKLLGVGVEVAAHVHNGVVLGATHVGLAPGGEFDLLAELQHRLQVPVVIDNDVNVLAVRQTYAPLAERHVAVVAVMEDGVGASLILDGHVYRGGGGMASEPGHAIVGVLPTHPDGGEDRPVGAGPGFRDDCHCGQERHVDCYAVPSRLVAELGAPLDVAGPVYARDATGLTREATIFRIGGEALGQGIASIINVVNPSRVILVLPAELARADLLTQDISATKGPEDVVGYAEPGTAAAEYLEGVEAAVDQYSFSRGARDARAGQRRLTVRVLERTKVEKYGAICAAIRVLDSFVMHARERDRCYELAADGTRPAASSD